MAPPVGGGGKLGLFSLGTRSRQVRFVFFYRASYVGSKDAKVDFLGFWFNFCLKKQSKNKKTKNLVFFWFFIFFNKYYTK